MTGDTARRALLRVLLVVLCLGALVDPRPLGGSDDLLPVAVVDVSASVGPAHPGVPEGVRVRSLWILVADGIQEVVGGAEPTRLARGATRLGLALRHAAERYPGSDVLLLGDGRGTDGDALAGARRIAAAGGRLFCAPAQEPAADVALLRAELVATAPSPIIRAETASSTSGGAHLRLSRDGTVVDQQRISLSPGRSQLTDLSDPGPPPEGCTYRVTLVPAPGTPDDDPGNDLLLVGLQPETRVALLWGLGRAEGLASGPDLAVRTTQDLEPAELAGVDCLVMANIPWRDLGPRTSRALEGFVAAGGSLLILGGPDAYAGGGWAGTRFEERLAPLRVRRREGLGLALVLAVDHSGSTQGATLAHLKEATRRAVQGVAPGERLAVLPFAAEPAAALLPPGPLGTGENERAETLLEALDALEAGGTTDLPAAIEEAARRAATIQARERRVLLLTDGDPDDPPDPARLRRTAAFLEDRGIRFGALVVGDEAAASLLRATLAGRPGDVQLLRDAADLPLGLLHRLGDLRNRASRLPRPSRLRPAPGAAAPFALEAFRPREMQHLEVAADQGATALVVAAYDDAPPGRAPFAAHRRVGAGRVGALAWGPQLEALRDRAALQAPLRPWIAALASSADRGLAADLVDEEIVLRFPEARGAGSLAVRTAEGESRLVEQESGIFRGPLPAGAEGGVRVEAPTGGAGPRPLRLPARPPPEHRGAGVDEARLQALAVAGGGRRLAPGVQPPAPGTAARPSLAPWLLLLACILLVLDRVLAKPDESPTDSQGTRRP